VGKTHLRYYRLKEALKKYEDKHFDLVASEFSKLPNEKQNLFNLFKITFKNNPAFLFDVIKIFTSF